MPRDVLGSYTLPPSHTKALATAFDLTNPAITPVLSGSFVPLSDTVEVDISVNHMLRGHFGSWAPWSLYYGANPSPLTPVHQSDALAAGVSQVRLGRTSALVGNTSAPLTLTGLVPGQRVYYEISSTITGGARAIPSGDGPYSVGFSKVNPERGSCWLALFNANVGTLEVYRVERGFAFGERKIGTLAGVAGFGRAAASPDGRFAVATNQGDQSLRIASVNRDTDVVAAVGVGRFVVPGTTPAPLGVACDNTYAWIANVTTKTLVRCTLADGTMGAALDLGVTGAGVWSDVAIAPAGNFIYVVINAGATSKVVKVQASNQTVVGNLVVPHAYCLAVAPDGTNVYVGMRGQSNGTAGAPYAVRKVRTSDMTAQGADASVGGNRPTAMEMFPDGRGFLVACDLPIGGSARQLQHLLTATDPPSTYVEFANQLGQVAQRAAFDVAVNDWGDFIVPANEDDQLNVWFGGALSLDPTNNFNGDALRIRVRGAVS